VPFAFREIGRLAYARYWSEHKKNVVFVGSIGFDEIMSALNADNPQADREWVYRELLVEVSCAIGV